MRVIVCCNVMLVILSAALTASGAAGVVATQSAMKSFVGNQGGLIAFVDTEDNQRVKMVDFNDATLAIRTVSSQTSCSDPIISGDGTRILWVQGGKVWTQRLSGGSAVEFGTGVNGFWHTEGQAEYIIYCDATAKAESNKGKTYRQKIMNDIEPDGARETIYSSRAMDAGITSDGRWLGETYGGHGNRRRVCDCGNRHSLRHRRSDGRRYSP